MPLAERLVDEAAVAELVLELSVLVAPVERLDAVAEQPRGDLGAGEGREHRAIAEVDLLDEVLAVEEIGVDPGAALLVDRPVERGGLGLAERLRHLGAGLERAEIEAGQPRVRAEQLHVERVVLAPPQDAGLVGVPAVAVVRAPGVLDALPGPRPEPAEPVDVAGELPVPVEFQDVAELAVGAGPFGGVVGAERQAEPEAHAAGLVHVVGVVGLAHRAFERREEEGQRLLVVPDVGAASLAAAGVRVAALPAVEGAVLEAERRRRLEDAEIGGRRVEHRQGQGRAVERVAKGEGRALELVPARQHLVGDLARAGPFGRVPVPPLPLRARRLPEMPDRRHPVLAEVRRVPGDDEAHRPRLARRARRHGRRPGCCRGSAPCRRPCRWCRSRAWRTGRGAEGPSSRPRAHRTSGRDRGGPGGWWSRRRWRAPARHSRAMSGRARR